MPRSPPTDPLDITIAICTRDRPFYLRECLAGLARQDRLVPVLIVDSASGPEAARELRGLAAAHPGARVIRLERPGLSVARNAALAAVPGGYVAFLDDDAVPAPRYVPAIAEAVADAPRRPAVLGGRVLPFWEAALPAWWPEQLRGVLSLVEVEGRGELGVDAGMEPCGANFIVDAALARSVGGFSEELGRDGTSLLSDEETLLMQRLARAGHLAWFDDRILVHHQIQAGRLRPEWLLRRMYWQGYSRVLSRRALGLDAELRAELARRLVLAALLAPLAAWSSRGTRGMAARWRRAYAAGFVRAMWRTGRWRRGASGCMSDRAGRVGPQVFRAGDNIA